MAIKTGSSKSGKIEIFAKGLTHGFGLNWLFFHLSFFKRYRPGKCVLRYSRTKKRLPRPYKQKVQKVEKLRYLQRG